MSWEISLLYICSWNFIWFLQKESTTVKNFRLLNARVKFHQICTLIGYFWWKYIKLQLKKYGGDMILKSGGKFEEKLTCGLENDMRNLATFHQNTWKCQVSELVFSWDPFVQSIKCMSCNFRGVISNNTEEWWKIWRGIDLLFQIDITNLTNFESRTWESQTFTL